MGNTREDKKRIMFATHRNTDVFYVTSNDKFFYTEQDAESAAQLLEDKKVDKLERDSVPANEELEKEIEAKKAAEKSTAENADAPNNPDGSQGEEGDDSSKDDDPSNPEKTEGADTDQKDEQDADQSNDQSDDQSGNDKDDQADQSDVKSLDSLKDEYKELTGKPAHHTWDAARIEEKIAEAKAEASEDKGTTNQ